METIVPTDPIKLAIAWLDGTFPWPVKVTKNRPNPTTGRIVTVRQAGGNRTSLVVDGSWLSVECFADTDEQAAALAAYTWGRLHAMQGEVIAGVQCYRVVNLAGPSDFPSVEEGIATPRFVMSVQAQFRAHAVT